MFLVCPEVLKSDLNGTKVIILSARVSSIANTAISLSGVDIIMNNNESNNIYFSANASTFLIADLELGSLF